MIKERLKQLRALMNERGIQYYIVPTSDFHETEYVGEHFKARKYMSNFSGSQGTLLVTTNEAYLWTDGRYFIQAANELKDTTITLMKMGEEGVLTLSEFLADSVKDNEKVGFDGRVMNTALVKKIINSCHLSANQLAINEDLVGMIWEDRPPLPSDKGFFLIDKYSGKSTQAKIADIRAMMKKEKANVHVITSLDDIAWILNMRGNDIEHYPVMLSYLVLYEDRGSLFIDENKLDEQMLHNLTINNIKVMPYDGIYDEVASIKEENVVLLNENVVNYAIYSRINAKIVNKANPSQLMKAMKNEVELNNTRHAHILDGAAVCKFMYWLKQNIGKIEISEISASDVLANFRKEMGAIDLSFNTIAAYKDHGAMMHYSANAESNAILEPSGMLLVDSGGHYYEGTTDITRTFVLGELKPEERYYFTMALRSHIRLAKAKFLYGCTGINLDILARGPLWDIDLDYKCGTGHGVGHLLNVHEGPNGFRWRVVPERNDSCVLEEGMVVTNEPGVYLEDKLGVRHENELIVRKGNKNEYGQFMYLETMTFVPFDIDGIDASLLTKEELCWLNDYHQEVYDKISPYLDENEKEWLKEACKAIS